MWTLFWICQVYNRWHKHWLPLLIGKHEQQIPDYDYELMWKFSLAFKRESCIDHFEINLLTKLIWHLLMVNFLSLLFWTQLVELFKFSPALNSSLAQGLQHLLDLWYVWGISPQKEPWIHIYKEKHTPKNYIEKPCKMSRHFLKNQLSKKWFCWHFLYLSPIFNRKKLTLFV